VRLRLAGLGVGLVFGLVLAWSGMMSPDVIRRALLFEDSYLFLFFGSAVVTAGVGLRLLRRSGRVAWTPERPERRHVAGALIFGVGWAVSDACPGPIAAQLGQGIGWAVWTLTGVLLGVYLFLRRSEDTEPACDPAPSASALRAPARSASPS
jgi:uncharacterized membrane protein YedE/YeeE